MRDSHTNPPVGGDGPHRNQQLFSDYYLDRKLPAREDWKALVPTAASVMAEIRRLFDAYTPSGNEA